MASFIKAATFLLLDLLSSLVFAGSYALTHDIYLATGLGVAIGLGQIGWELARRQRPDAMQWMSLGLVLFFGGATLLTHNPLFIKVKPALVYVIVGGFMCVPGWMNRYMPAIVEDNAPDLPRLFGFVWAGLMFFTAAATTFVAFRYDDKTYAEYLASFPLVSKIALFCLQYAVVRVVTERRVRARLASGELTAADVAERWPATV